MADDLALAEPMAEGGMSLEALWKPLNEHRIPLARAILFGLLQATRDLRAGMFFQVAMLALAALLLIVAARRVRGTTSYADAVFPLLLLPLSNSFNLLMGIQIAVTLPTVVVCLVLAHVSRTRAWARTDVAAVGAWLLLLPFASGVGLLQAPVWFLWLGVAGVAWRRSSHTESRRTAPVALGFATAGVLAIVVYFVGFRFPQRHSEHAALGDALAASGRFLAMSFGTVGRDLFPLSAWVVALFAASAAVLLVRVFIAHANERASASALAAGLLGALAVALGVGWGRGAETDVGGSALRYVTMSTPILCASYLAWVRFGSRASARAIGVLLSALSLGAYLGGIRPALEHGRAHKLRAESFAADVADGRSIPELVERHSAAIYSNADVYRRRLRWWRLAGLAPFPRKAPPQDASDVSTAMFVTQPAEVQAVRVLVRELRDEQVDVLGLLPGSQLIFDLDRAPAELRAGFGVLPKSRGKASGLRFCVVLAEGDRRRVLFERTLDTVHRGEDIGLQELRLELPSTGEARGRLLFTLDAPGESPPPNWWGYWTAIELR